MSDDRDEKDLEFAIGVRRQCASCHGSGRRLVRIDRGMYEHEIVGELCAFCGGLGHVDPEAPFANSSMNDHALWAIDDAREEFGL